MDDRPWYPRGYHFEDREQRDGDLLVSQVDDAVAWVLWDDVMILWTGLEHDCRVPGTVLIGP